LKNKIFYTLYHVTNKKLLNTKLFSGVRLYLGGGWAKPKNGKAIFGRGVGGAV